MPCASFVPLPSELWGCITFYLSGTDIKSLRLTCTQVNNAVPFRLDRVFLSANPLNIEVFRNIASDEKLRYLVTEVIWDEARLTRGPARTSQTDRGQELLSDEDEPNIAEGHKYRGETCCPKWFKDACEENLRILRSLKSADKDRPEHIRCREQILAQPPLEECWKYYQHLLRQQNQVLADDSDLEAFSFGVKQFPALKKVTITPAAHGNLFSPLYPTPMIRAFPKGFNYPIPRGWLYFKSYFGPATAYSWNRYPELRERYRGFCTAMRVLANEPNSVLKNPGFRRLDISLLVGGEDESDLEPCWRSFLNGRLHRALSEATEIEDFRLHATFDDELAYNDAYPLIPLRNIIPVEKWPNLRHFELSSFSISQDDCISFLGTLPKTIRSIELSMLDFLDDGCWYSMLEEIQRMVSEGTLWRDLSTTCRPKITIGLSAVDGAPPTFGRAKWIEKEVRDFVCGSGSNPFDEPGSIDISYGTGVLKDAFDPNFERPNVGPKDLIRLNIRKKASDWDYTKY
ncbi:hypothetical protein N7509_000563 [Penicillium cosmopolitanum]|uniref:F-box domain-containing protein n=1 Tax=Penicillium cosmopolitanum TaxID=1131564 RepID=A0A9W9WAT9_9EURO|nr:uncharacterized protein N7509_000563 [Penicillium cosmopolitanum]KAJ5413936.1 hypothetical protein N7509_000563 [Penicillium cosmopolitanum]